MKNRKFDRYAIDTLAKRIATKAMEHERDAHQAKYQSLLERVHTHLVPPTVAAQLDALPENVRPGKRGSFIVEVEKKYNGSLTFLFGDKEERYAPKYNTEVTDLPDALADEVRAYYRERNDLNTRYQSLFDELHENIKTAGGTTRLIDLWPEAKEIIIDYYGEVEHVETPLATILSRYLTPQLEAPSNPDTTPTE